jgi:HEPN domain-containing protein
MDNRDIAQEWFAIANTDLASAVFLQAMRPTPIEVICYHCQQAAEKYLKGFLALQGEPPQKTHDLLRLNKNCQQYDPSFITIEKSCLLLTDYGVNVRYPFPMDIDESDMHTALKHAQQVKEFVLGRVLLV